ncbi:MAG: ABC transporter permease [Chloroflexi bacterium]|nr:ABC transporter permease [Chloroflexota bacterium]
MQRLWSEIGIVLSEEVRRGIRRKQYLIITFTPVVIVLVLALAAPLVRGFFGSDSESADRAGDGRVVAVVNRSPDLTFANLESSAVLAFADRQAGIAALQAGDVDDLFIVPEEFIQTGRIEWLHTDKGISSIIAGDDSEDRMRDLVLQALTFADLSAEQIGRLRNPLDLTRYEVTRGGDVAAAEEGQILTFFTVPFLSAWIMIMVIFMVSGTLLQSVSEEKENRVVEVLITSVSPLALMSGKVLGLGATGLLQVGIWLVSLAVLGPRIVGAFPEIGDMALAPALALAIVVFFLAGYFVFAVVMTAISAATVSAREASSLSTIILLPALTPLVLATLISLAPNGAFARILTFIPFTAPATMMIRLGVTDVALWEVALSLGVTIVSGLALLWLSARVFRAGILIYGQRMTLRRLWLALRHAN